MLLIILLSHSRSFKIMKRARSLCDSWASYWYTTWAHYQKWHAYSSFLVPSFYLLYLFFNSSNRNDAFSRRMLVKQSSSFSRKHRILSPQICVRQTVQLTQKPGWLQNMATDAGMCVHCTRHLSAIPATSCSASMTHWQGCHKTSTLLVNGESVLCACMKAKGHHFEHLLN